MAKLKDLGVAALAGQVAYNAYKYVSGGKNISQGAANVITGLNPARATDALKEGTSKVLGNPNTAKSGGKNLTNIVPNALEKFASFTPIWTLACLEPQQFNNPPSYRNNPSALKHVVVASAGRFDSQRVKTANGIPEYFINNFTMKCTVAANERTGNSNAFKFEWDIYEPYSMGTLLQSLQLAALNAGYLNYLDNAPYVLRLDFMGWDELGREYKVVKPKFFVMKLTGVKFSVNEGGSTYKMEAVPYNHQGFSDVTNTAFKDIKIQAGSEGTVLEALKTAPGSLASILNANESKLEEEGRIGKRDVYDIQFPETSADFQGANEIPNVKKATLDPNAILKNVIKGTNIEVLTEFSENPISRASFGFDQKDGGNFPFKKHGDQVDEKTGIVKRDNMNIDPKNRSFQFSQGQTLTAIINQIILSSDYAKAAMDPKNMVNGFIKWFRLDLQIELLDYDELIGDFAKKITFRVVPFLVHSSIFSNPNAAPVGLKELEKKIVKEYNYIYTGKNVDVLKFDIQINNLFYTGANPSPENTAGKASDPNTQGIAENPNKIAQTGKGAATDAQANAMGRARPKRSPALLNKPKGGSGTTTTEQQVAENFHNAFISGSSADLIKVSLEILGDPYWMVDSGIGNYFTKATPGEMITDDGTMNYESGDVYIYLSFSTPSDVNELTGRYDFKVGSKESAFSGIYRVIMCENQFNEGMFKQKLECIRMPGPQPNDKENGRPVTPAPVDIANTSAIKIGKVEAPKTSPSDDNTEADKTANG